MFLIHFIKDFKKTSFLSIFNPRQSRPLLLSFSVRPIPTFSIFIPDVDVSVLEAGALLWILVALQLGYQGRLTRFLVTYVLKGWDNNQRFGSISF